MTRACTLLLTSTVLEDLPPTQLQNYAGEPGLAGIELSSLCDRYTGLSTQFTTLHSISPHGYMKAGASVTARHRSAVGHEGLAVVQVRHSLSIWACAASWYRKSGTTEYSFSVPMGVLNFNAGSARKTVVAMGAKDENEALPAFKVLNEEEFAAFSGREKMAHVSRAIEAIHDGKNSATLWVAVGQPG